MGQFTQKWKPEGDVAPPGVNESVLGFNNNSAYLKNPDGSVVYLGADSDTITANRGVGLESETPGDPQLNDIFVTSDTLLIRAYDLLLESWEDTPLTQKNKVLDVPNVLIYFCDGIRLIQLDDTTIAQYSDEEANIPTTGLTIGDVFVSTDTFKKFVADSTTTFGTGVLLIKKSFVFNETTGDMLFFTGTVLVNVSAGGIDLGTKENISTGIIYGGELTPNADPSKFDIEAGASYIVDAYTTPQISVFVKLTWAKQEAVVVTNIGSQLITYVTVSNNAGSPQFLQVNATQSTEASRDAVELGVLVHTDLATISKMTSFPNWNRDTDLKILDIASVLGRINVDGGNEYSFNGTNKQIDKTEGRMFALNGNYGLDKNDPNFIDSSLETALTFLTVYGDSGSQIGSTNVIDTDNYNPEGAGGLIPIPDELWTTHGIFFSPDTGLTVVHYGQFLYDSALNAINSWRKENYTIVPELKGVALRGVLAFKSGATDLSDPDQARFIDPGAFGILVNENIPSFSRFGEPVDLLNGMSSFPVDITLIESGGKIYAEVERETYGGDIDFIFNQREYTLDCTTGPGTDGKSRIELTPGPSSDVTATNWLYVIRSNDVAILQVSPDRPTGEFSYLHVSEIPNVATFISTGAELEQRYNDSKSWGGRSSVQRSNEWIRTRRPEYEDGLNQTVTIDAGPSPDNIDYTQVAGEAWQKHLQANIPQLQVSVDGIRIANHPTAPGLKVFNLNSAELLQDSSGNSLSGSSFNWVIWTSVGYKGNCGLWINLPEKEDDSATAAVSKQNNGDRSVPKKYKSVGILSASLPFNHKSVGGGQYINLASTLLSTQVIDLRGKLPDSTSGGSGSSVVNEFLDSLFRIIKNGFAFTAQFLLTNLTASRVYTMQDKDGVIAHLDDIAGDLTVNRTNPTVSAGSLVIPFASKQVAWATKSGGDAIDVGENITITRSDDTIKEREYVFLNVNGAERTITLPAATISNDSRAVAGVVTLPVGIYVLKRSYDGTNEFLDILPGEVSGGDSVRIYKENNVAITPRAGRNILTNGSKVVLVDDAINDETEENQYFETALDVDPTGKQGGDLWEYNSVSGKTEPAASAPYDGLLEPAPEANINADGLLGLQLEHGYDYEIYIKETAGNAAGTISLGSTSLGTDIVVGDVVGASTDAKMTVIKGYWSAVNDTPLYISSTAWGTGIVQITIVGKKAVSG